MWRYTLAFTINSLICFYPFLVFGADMRGSEAILITLAFAFVIATVGNISVIRLAIPEEEQRASMKAAIRTHPGAARLLYVHGTVLGLLSTAVPILLLIVFPKNNVFETSAIVLPILGFPLGAFLIHRTLKRAA